MIDYYEHVYNINEIVNIINLADVITYLPFPQWGFERYGVDLILPTDSGDAELEARAEAAYLERSDISGRFLMRANSPKW